MDDKISNTRLYENLDTIRTHILNNNVDSFKQECNSLWNALSHSISLNTEYDELFNMENPNRMINAVGYYAQELYLYSKSIKQEEFSQETASLLLNDITSILNFNKTMDEIAGMIDTYYQDTKDETYALTISNVYGSKSLLPTVHPSEVIAILDEQKLQKIRELTANSPVITVNKHLGKIQLRFNSPPDEIMRNEIKKQGFRWIPSYKAWQRSYDEKSKEALDVLRKEFGWSSLETSNPIALPEIKYDNIDIDFEKLIQTETLSVEEIWGPPYYVLDDGRYDIVRSNFDIKSLNLPFDYASWPDFFNNNKEWDLKREISLSYKENIDTVFAFIDMVEFADEKKLVSSSERQLLEEMTKTMFDAAHDDTKLFQIGVNYIFNFAKTMTDEGKYIKKNFIYLNNDAKEKAQTFIQTFENYYYSKFPLYQQIQDADLGEVTKKILLEIAPHVPEKEIPSFRDYVEILEEMGNEKTKGLLDPSLYYLVEDQYKDVVSPQNFKKLEISCQMNEDFQKFYEESTFKYYVTEDVMIDENFKIPEGEILAYNNFDVVQFIPEINKKAYGYLEYDIPIPLDVALQHHLFPDVLSQILSPNENNKQMLYDLKKNRTKDKAQGKNKHEKEHGSKKTDKREER